MYRILLLLLPLLNAKADADVAADVAAAAGQPDACPGLLKLPQHLHKV